MKLKKLLATGLTVVMALGMLAGCGSSGKDNGASSSGNQDSVSTGTETETTQSTQADSGEIVNLKWVTIGNGMPTNYDSWIAKVNEYIGEKDWR